MKLLLNDIFEASLNRPEGYVDDVLSKGVVEEDWVEMEDEVYFQLKNKYSPSVEGLGDVVSVFAQPIARAIDSVTGGNLQGCSSCERRRKLLNAWVPFSSKDLSPTKTTAS